MAIEVINFARWCGRYQNRPMKIPQLFRHKKLLAATARRTSAAAGMDFEDIREPNMKLSRALLIVLLLHIVAVSGIIAFNAIKTRESSFVPAAPANPQSNAAVPAPLVHGDAAKGRPAVSQKEIAPRNDPKPSHSPSKEEHAKTPSSSGKTYIVKKGDNPVTIAKKLKVSYDDLIALNHIEDPHKLQIGQKLVIPGTVKAKATNAKTTSRKEKKK
jgi:nucleoid-associated protein YgaU